MLLAAEWRFVVATAKMRSSAGMLLSSDVSGFVLGVSTRPTVRMGEGWRDTASAPLCHLPGLCAMLNLQESVASLKSCMRGFFILLRSRSLKIPSKGL